MASPFGVMLSGYMTRGDWTQESLGAHSGVHHTFISKLINGKRMPSRSNALAISKALGLSEEERNRLLKAAGFSVHDAGMPDWLVEFTEVVDDPRLPTVVRENMIAIVERTTMMAILHLD